MHIVIVGVGGVGGYFGGKLIQAQHKVTLIARGQHLDAIQNHGLQVKSIDGDFTVHPFLATDRLEDVTKADLILICTKSWQVVETAKWIHPILKDNTIVIPLQNGADNIQKLSNNMPKHHVVGGLCKIYSKKESPGVISHFGHPPELIFGEIDTHSSERLTNIKNSFEQSGFKATIPNNIHIAIWSKFMFIATVSGLGALTRVSIGTMYADTALRALLEQTAIEIYNVGIATGIPLPDTMVTTTMAFISKQPYDATASTQRDIMAGLPSELDNFNGFIVRKGKALGVPTPTNTFIYNCLRPMEAIARGAGTRRN